MFDTEKFFSLITDSLDERSFRLVVAAVAEAECNWNLTYIARCAKVSRSMLYDGLADLHGAPLGNKPNGEKRQRVLGGGRKDVVEKDPSILEDIRGIIEPHIRGDPMNPTCWISKSQAKISARLKAAGHQICANTVGRLLDLMGFTRQSCKKSHEHGDSPDRDRQISFIAKTTAEFIARGLPAISVDTKKKELVGEFKNAGSDYHRMGNAPEVEVHDFIAEGGRATPYGVYDINENKGFVNVGTCADTGEFAVESIEKWWDRLGKSRYPEADELFIMADGGGSNGSRNRLWKKSLQEFATRNKLTVTVAHFPPGTSKWNKIEHRMFAFISQNWRGRPLTSVDVIVNLISNTTTTKGLSILAERSDSNFQPGVKVSQSVMDKLNIRPNELLPEWNYTITPE